MASCGDLPTACFFFSSRRRHTRLSGDWSSDVCSSDLADLGLPEAMLNRPVNDGFSGGERKRNELLQLALLRPRLAILDEIDSGMDVDGVRAVVSLVQKLRGQGMAFLVVSHYLQMIESLEPDAVHRLDQGRIGETGGIDLARQIARTGYARSPQAVEA